MSFFLLIIFIAIGWLLHTLYLKKLLQQGKPGQIKIALIVLGLVFLFMALSGRAPALFAILGAAMTQIMRIAPLLIRFAPFLKKYIGSNIPGSARQGVSQVVTPTLIMTLDQATGHIDGQIIAGELADRSLSSLTLDEIRKLYQHCEQQDSEALRLLQTYITRERAEEWQNYTAGAGDSGYENQNNGSHSISSTEMSVTEARQVLGLEDTLSRDSIVAAHRSLMGRFHPDKGGNDYLATKLNTARDVLLANLPKNT